MFVINDLVCIKSDINKIVYSIVNIEENIAFLEGYIYRIKTSVTIDDIEYASDDLILKEDNTLNKVLDKTTKQRVRSSNKVIYGTVLHIDGDEKFLNSCVELYKEMNIHCWGLHIKENQIKNCIDKILDEITPDIVVLTGHDYFNGKDIKDINNYENTPKFIEVIRLIRRRFDKDSVIIIAGACSSHFESLIANGANFASSPKRINIHTYDPAVIAIKCATTSCNQTIDFNNLLKFIENGRDAYGAIETKGKMKLLM